MTNNQKKQPKHGKPMKKAPKIAHKPKHPKLPKQKKNNNRQTNIGKALRAVGSMVGTAIGQPGVGSLAGAGISRIFGQGDYTVEKNSMMSGAPSFAALNQGIRIRHREFIGDISSSVAFTNTTYNIQPTDATAFPWLSQIAANFEQYKLHGLVYTFNTTAGNAISSTNNALGVIGIVTSYDPSASAFANKRQCEDYMGCVSGVPSASLIHPVECKPKSDVLERYYTLNKSVASGDEDLKFYNHGIVNVFTVGSQAATTIGEIWVSYDFEFFNPRLEVTGAQTIADHFYTSGVSLTNTLPLSSSTVVARSGSNLGSTLVNSVLTLPNNSASSIYLLALTLNSTGAGATTTIGIAGSSNISSSSILTGDSAGSAFASMTNFTTYLFTVSKSNTSTATITFSASNLTTQTGQYDLFVIPLPAALVTLFHEIRKQENNKIRLMPAIHMVLRDLFDRSRAEDTARNESKISKSRDQSQERPNSFKSVIADMPRDDLTNLLTVLKRQGVHERSFESILD